MAVPSFKERYASMGTVMYALFTGAFILLSVVGLLVALWFSRQTTLKQLTVRLEAIVTTAALQLETEFDSESWVDNEVTESPKWVNFQTALRKVQKANHLEPDHLYVFNLSGDLAHLPFAVMLHEKPFVGALYETPSKIQELLQQMRMTDRSQKTSVYQDAHGKWISAMAPLHDATGKIAGVLQADYRLDQQDRAYRNSFYATAAPLILLFVLMMPLGVILIVWISRTIAKPIQQLAKVAEFMASGNWEHPLPDSRWGELRQLKRALERMREKVQEQLDYLRDFNQVLEQKVDARTLDLKRANESLAIQQRLAAQVNQLEKPDEMLQESALALHHLMNLEAVAFLLPVQVTRDEQVKVFLEVFRFLPGHEGELRHERLEHLPDSLTPWLNGEREVSFSLRRELGRTFLAGDPQGQIILPLEVRNETIGVLLLGHSDPDYFGEIERELLDGLTHQIAAGVQKSLLIEDLRTLNQEVELAKENLRRQSEAQIRYQKTHDNVTGLGNHQYFTKEGMIALAVSQLSKKAAAVLAVDVDRFSKLKETFNDEAISQLLREVASRVSDHLKTKDLVARIESDQFAILIQELHHADDASKVGRRLLESLSQPFYLDGMNLHVSASIGIATFPEDGHDPEELFRHAVTAAGKVKEEGGNGLKFYTQNMNTDSLRRLALENELRMALEMGQFLVYYQPKVEIATGRMVGMEALMRWEHPLLGLVSPAEFIPLAEETGVIVPMGKWLLEEVCQRMRFWREMGLPELTVAVNLSARQFRQVDLVDHVRDALERNQIPNRQLELEITESVAMVHIESTLRILARFKAMNLTLAIDDFGTGYSSLSYLKQFALDRLKIDKAFVKDLPSNQEDAAIARAIISLAHSLGLRVTAEGVETKAQLTFLAENECDEYQGYLFSRPVPHEKIEVLMAEEGELEIEIGRSSSKNLD